MERTFDTPDPITLYVEIGSGSVTITAAETTTTQVNLVGDAAEETTVTHDGQQISIIAPRKTSFFNSRGADLRVQVTVPTGSALATKTGSADQLCRGSFGNVRAKSGSGEMTLETVAGAAVLDTGSGDITVATVESELRCKCGSGDVKVGTISGQATISTGSGDIEIDRHEATLLTKSGSGSLRVHQSAADLHASSGSGDVVVDLFTTGSLTTKSASGDVRIGVPSGIPVWTDVSTVSGRISSELEGAGQPKDGDPYLELRLTTVSGDIVLDQH